jgi:HK97 family phage major capsid protein
MTLEEAKSAKIDAHNTLKTITESLKTDKGLRSMTDDENTKFEAAMSAKAAAELTIERIEKATAAAAAFAKSIPAPTTFETQENPKDLVKAAGSYSVIKAIKGAMTGKLEGLEAEMHEEAIQEAKLFGKSIEGVGIPYIMVKTPMNVGTTVNFGSDMVPTALSNEIIMPLQPTLFSTSLGAQSLTGLTGDLEISEVTANGTAAWEGEFDDNAESSSPTTKRKLSPHRLGAYQDFGKQWMVQTSISAENFVRGELMKAKSILLDSTYFQGSGTDPVPRGLLNVSGIGSVAIGTNGGVPTWDHIVDLETAIDVDNGLATSMAYVTTPGIKGKLKKTFINDTGQVVWDRIGAEPLNGYRAFSTTQLPSNLTKGSSSGNCHAIIFGDFANSIIAQWGGYDIVIDPYTRALKTQVRVVLNSWWDIFFRHPQKFAAILDAKTA